MTSRWLLVSGDFVRTGGMDMANYALASYLAEAGSEVHLVAHSVSPDLLKHRNLKFHRIPKVAQSYLLSGPLLDFAGRWCASRMSRRGVRVVVNGGNCRWGDLNWVHYVHAMYSPCTGNSLLTGLKSRCSRPSLLAGERETLATARLVIANSEATRTALTERLAIPPERVHTVYYGIDPGIYYPSGSKERILAKQSLGWEEGRPVAVFVGALSDRRKGFDTVYSAWAKLCADPAWDTGLAVIGTGREAAAWKRKAAAEGLGARIRFLGFRANVDRVLAAADMLVAPSRYEAYGLAVHEALCCGIPALVSRCAGVAERYPGELAELLIDNPDDADELVSRLVQVRRKLDEYKTKMSYFSQSLRRRTWRDMALDIVNLADSAA